MVHVIDLHFCGTQQTIGAFLVESQEGPILVETGPYSTFPQLERSINDLGYQIGDIKHVLLSHIHLDHAGAAWALAKAGAKVYVHPFGAKHLLDPSKLMSSAKRIYQDQMDSLWGRMEAIPRDQLIEVADQAVFQFGERRFVAWHTPGHAVHHIAWQLEDILFSGDVAGVKIGANGPIVPPCPPPDINVEDWQASIQLVKSLPLKAMYLTHFDKITNVREHLDQLEATILSWANWIRPYFEQGTPIPEIVPAFEKFVKKSLVEQGLKAEELLQYEIANPSWMSVAGLVRYWKKRSQN